MTKKNLSQKSDDKKVVAIYCRVSTYMQGAADFSSLDAQESQLKSFCEGKGWEIYHKIYKDTKTGSTLERDELQNLLRDAEDGKFNVVLATKLDRFSRSMRNFYELSERLEALGVDIVTATQNIDTTTSQGKFFRDIFLAFAEFERNIIAERTRESLYTRAKQGFWGGGHVPLGYDVVEKKLQVNELEKKVVNKIFNYYLLNPSTRTVAKIINEEGEKTKIRVSKKGIRTGGNPFVKQSIIDILKNKVYIGLIRVNDEYFKGIHESIVDEELFEKVQKRLKASSQDTNVVRRTTSPLTLLGLTKCGLCGNSLTSTSSKGGRHYYYKCSKKIHNTSDHCNAKDLPAKELENCVLQVMNFLIDDEGFFNAIFKQINNNSSDELTIINENLTTLISNKNRIQKKIDNLYNRMSEDEDFSNSNSYKDTINKLESEKMDLSKKIQHIEHQKENISGRTIDKNNLKILLADFLNIYDSMTIEGKKRFNHLFFVEIVSHFKSGDEDGVIEIKIRGDGKLEKKWSEIKNANYKTTVRTSNILGSASRTRTCNPSVNSRMLHH